MVARDVTVVAVVHGARKVGEGVPDRGALPILVGGSLVLVRGGRDAPEKVLGEHELIAHQSVLPRTDGHRMSGGVKRLPFVLR